MALTTEQIEEARIAVFKAHGADLIPEVATTLARAIEAEARRDALEEAAKVCESMHEEDRPGDYAYSIRKLKEDIQ